MMGQTDQSCLTVLVVSSLWGLCQLDKSILPPTFQTYHIANGHSATLLEKVWDEATNTHVFISMQEVSTRPEIYTKFIVSLLRDMEGPGCGLPAKRHGLRAKLAGLCLMTRDEIRIEGISGLDEPENVYEEQ